MKQIQWFPGHMAKAVRMMEENAAACDGAIIVLDARAARATMNENTEKIFSNKPVLYLVNKIDLVTESDAAQIVSSIGSFRRAAGVSAMSNKCQKVVYNAINELCAEKLERMKARGALKPLRFIVCGIPNTGKSAVINAVTGKKVAVTGDRAGVTRGKQWIRLGKIELLDTPGTMPPSLTDQRKALHLAYIGCIRDEILDMTEIALEFIAEIGELYPDALRLRYGVSVGSPQEILGGICRARGYLLSGGEVDFERGAKAVIDDFRKGRLGKIILEK